MRKYITIFVLSVLSILNGYSQNEDDRILVPDSHNPLQNYQSPSVSTFNTYGSIPVSLYTGTPQISIPIYTISVPQMQIPISLSYNINNVKPNTHPGIVGLGWNLFAGGNITRTQRGNSIDEIALSDRSKPSFLNKFSQNNWSSQDSLYKYADVFRPKQVSSDGSYLEINTLDIIPDKFTFNFLNYSGAFYLDESGKWIVDSETLFEVEHTMGDQYDLRNSIRDGLASFGPNNPNYCSNNQDMRSYTPFFEKFILKAPNGIVFEFGGAEAIDYSANFHNRTYYKEVMPKATTWHLSKIKLTNGEEVIFHYKDSPPNLENSMSFWIQSNYSFANANKSLNFTFHFILPVLLDKITYLNKTLVSFEYENSVQQGYDYKKKYYAFKDKTIEDEFSSGIDDKLACSHLGGVIRYNVYVKSLNDIQWSQLNKINLPDNTYYSFEYTKSSDERLKLLSMKKANIKRPVSESEKHSFSYNSEKFPDYLTGFYDHLGFYNGQDFSFVFEDGFYSPKIEDLKENALKFNNSRQIDITGKYLFAEMLEKVQYPTGGHSIFEYEYNDVHALVSPERNSWNQASEEYEPFAGLRIKRITNYTDNGVFSNSKRYYYIIDFNPQYKTGRSSSGIAAFSPKYYWDNLDVLTTKNYYAKLEIFLANPTNQAYFNLDGQFYIGYSEVIECDENINGYMEGYTKYKYTNFDVGYFDDKPISDINQYISSNVYKPTPHSPYSSNKKKRGKLVSKEIYDRNNKLITAVYNEYAVNAYKERKDINIFSLRNNKGEVDSYNSHNPPGWIFSLGGAYLDKIYEYLPIETSEKTFIGSDSIEKITFFRYNDRNQIVRKLEDFKDGNTSETMIKHVGDLKNPSHQYLYGMQIAKLLNLPVEIIALKNNNVVGADIIHYNRVQDDLDFYLPFKYYKLESDNPITLNSYKQVEGEVNYTTNDLIIDPRCIPHAIYHKYDKYGNPIHVEVNHSHVVYLWSYTGKYPIAQIADATYDEVKSALGVDPEKLSIQESPDLNKVESLRNHQFMKKALITTYSYIPWVGMESSTDFRGITTYYEYDGLGRLIESYIMENGIKKKAQSYEYNYRINNNN